MNKKINWSVESNPILMSIHNNYYRILTIKFWSILMKNYQWMQKILKPKLINSNAFFDCVFRDLFLRMNSMLLFLNKLKYRLPNFMFNVNWNEIENGKWKSLTDFEI